MEEMLVYLCNVCCKFLNVVMAELAEVVHVDLHQLDGMRHITTICQKLSQIPTCDRLCLPVANLARKRKSSLAECNRALEIAQAPVDIAQVAQRIARATTNPIS
jgi:hypothetical protein